MAPFGAFAGVISLAVVQAAKHPHPTTSWHTVPIFCETSNVTGEFDIEALHTIAKFPLFVAEKAYNFPAPGFAEDKLAKLTKQLKALNPNITLIFYYNANLDLTDYRLYNLTAQHAPNWWNRDEYGNVYMAPIDAGPGATPPFPYNAATGGVPTYNFSVPELRTAWAQECSLMTSPEYGFDGCMVDRWTRSPRFNSNFTKAMITAFAAGRDLATGALATWAKSTDTWLVGEGTDVNAISDPGYGYNSGNLLHQLAYAEKGQGLLASTFVGAEGDRFISEIAMFLTGAAEGHFFGAGSWTVNHTSRLGVEWHDEYDMPLGKPLGNATKHGDTYYRSFAYGTNVTFTPANFSGTIAWGKFPEEH